ncbi:MAG: tRNA-dihydrouridine synthase [Collinsella sp.]
MDAVAGARGRQARRSSTSTWRALRARSSPRAKGSALMKAPGACGVVGRGMQCVRRACPVTVKIRRGFAAGENTAAEFAARMEQAGAAAVAVHGRTASQLYTGRGRLVHHR